eukprot:scaffold1556_cov278-Prasinococcus_capsulatus_cf.AAC.8
MHPSKSVRHAVAKDERTRGGIGPWSSACSSVAVATSRCSRGTRRCRSAAVPCCPGATSQAPGGASAAPRRWPPSAACPPPRSSPPRGATRAQSLQAGPSPLAASSLQAQHDDIRLSQHRDSISSTCSCKTSLELEYISVARPPSFALSLAGASPRTKASSTRLPPGSRATRSVLAASSAHRLSLSCWQQSKGYWNTCRAPSRATQTPFVSRYATR